MLTAFFLKRKIAELVRRSRDVHRLDQYESIVELGKLPPTDESLACLIEHTRMHNQNSGAAIRAISALGMMNDRRATDHLVRLIREKDGRIEDAIEKAFGQPHHASGLPELAEMARVLCRDHDDLFGTKCMTDLMRKIDPLASQPHIEALAPLVLESALRKLPVDKPLYVGERNPAEGILALCQQPSGLAALRALRDKLVPHHRQMIMTAGHFSDITGSLDWLRKSTSPDAAEAVTEFLRTPSRLVIKGYSRDVPREEWDGVRSHGDDSIWIEEPCYTSELGQPVGPEESAERDAAEHAQQAGQAARTERQRRENIYPFLLTHGDQRDLEDYAHACLTNPRYDRYLHDAVWRRDPDTLKLNNLALFLRRAPDTAKAAELLRLILAGDRTRLWASVREAIAWRGEYAGEIDWQPLAVELLEQTGDPAVDELLVSQIEAQWAADKPSPLLAILARRNPAQMVELAARHLLHRSPIGGPGEARQVVLASAPTALRVARELHGRTDWWARSQAFFFLSSVPEAEAELSAWVAAEADQECLDIVARQKGMEFVKRCKAAAAWNPSLAPSTPPATTSHPPADHAALWARVLACLEKRRAIPTGPATPGDIARHADAVLGHREVSRFVFEYYFPAIAGETPAAAVAQAWVEQFEKSA